MEKNSEDNLEERYATSKTRRKKDAHALQDIGMRLVQLDLKRLSAFDLPETLFDAIIEAKRIRAHGARRRQMQLIGKLMRDVDPAPVREKLDMLNRTTVHQVARLHSLERWRDRLLEDE